MGQAAACKQVKACKCSAAALTSHSVSVLGLGAVHDCVDLVVCPLIAVEHLLGGVSRVQHDVPHLRAAPGREHRGQRGQDRPGCACRLFTVGQVRRNVCCCCGLLGSTFLRLAGVPVAAGARRLRMFRTASGDKHAIAVCWVCVCVNVIAAESGLCLPCFWRLCTPNRRWLAGSRSVWNAPLMARTVELGPQQLYQHGGSEAGVCRGVLAISGAVGKWAAAAAAAPAGGQCACVLRWQCMHACMLCAWHCRWCLHCCWWAWQRPAGHCQGRMPMLGVFWGSCTPRQRPWRTWQRRWRRC
jgi:hypothetical protein